MIRRFKSDLIRFTRGASDGDGSIGLCDRRVIATAPDPASAARAMIMAAVWQR